MNKPTEPGWYWYDTGEKKTIVKVVEICGELGASGMHVPWSFIKYLHGTWGPRIEEWMPVEE